MSYLVRASSSVLNWSDSPEGSDLDDALDHVNLMRNRRMEKGVGNVEEIDEKLVDPESLLPKQAFKGKVKGWLLKVDRNLWLSEFHDVHEREIKHILELSARDGIPPVIVIDDEVGDGYARIILAYALNEQVAAVFYEETEGDEED